MNLYDVTMLVPMRVRVQAESNDEATKLALELRGNAGTEVLSCRELGPTFPIEPPSTGDSND